jgi:hypothetical protein
MPEIKKKINSERASDPVIKMLLSMGYDGENFRVNIDCVPEKRDSSLPMMSNKILEFIMEK